MTVAGARATRVVSLVPAGAEIVAALGMLDALVGAPPFSLDAARIAALAPTVILTQAPCAVCAVSATDVRATDVRATDVRALAARLVPAPAVVTLAASTLDGVLDDVVTVAAALGAADRGRALVDRLRARLRSVHETLKAARAPRPRVAVVAWTEPVYAAGHWVPDMVRRAGGIDVLGASGEHSRPRSVEEVRDAGAEVIVFAPCGSDRPRVAAEMARTLARDEWAWARGLRCVAADADAHVGRPGPRLVDGVEWMARAFNPAVFAR